MKRDPALTFVELPAKALFVVVDGSNPSLVFRKTGDRERWYPVDLKRVNTSDERSPRGAAGSCVYENSKVVQILEE